jgi:hypothetical protein
MQQQNNENRWKVVDVRSTTNNYYHSQAFAAVRGCLFGVSLRFPVFPCVPQINSVKRS